MPKRYPLPQALPAAVDVPLSPLDERQPSVLEDPVVEPAGVVDHDHEQPAGPGLGTGVGEALLGPGDGDGYLALTSLLPPREISQAANTPAIAPQKCPCHDTPGVPGSTPSRTLP